MLKSLEQEMGRFRDSRQALENAASCYFSSEADKERFMDSLGPFVHLAKRRLVEDLGRHIQDLVPGLVTAERQTLPEEAFTEPARDIAAQMLPYLPTRKGERRFKGAKKFSGLMTRKARDKARHYADDHVMLVPDYMPKQGDAVKQVALLCAAFNGKLLGYTYYTDDTDDVAGTYKGRLTPRADIDLIRAVLKLLYGDGAIEKDQIIEHLKKLRREKVRQKPLRKFKGEELRTVGQHLMLQGYWAPTADLTEQELKIVKDSSEPGLTALKHLKGHSPIPMVMVMAKDDNNSRNS